MSDLTSGRPNLVIDSFFKRKLFFLPDFWLPDAASSSGLNKALAAPVFIRCGNLFLKKKIIESKSSETITD